MIARITQPDWAIALTAIFAPIVLLFAAEGIRQWIDWRSR